MRRQGCLSIIIHQQEIPIKLMLNNTTSNTCKNQKSSRNLQEEGVEAI